jgi:hypothetical protein
MNHVWTGLWAGLIYLTSILLFLNFHEATPPLSAGEFFELRRAMTHAVLYGIFGAVLLGACWAWGGRLWRPEVCTRTPPGCRSTHGTLAPSPHYLPTPPARPPTPPTQPPTPPTRWQAPA